MKQILYGTTNPSKLRQVADILTPLGYDVKSLADFAIDSDVVEDGKTPEENARKKALAYAQGLKLPVLAMDAGLYFDDVASDKQPGLFVRRISGLGHATDKDMIEYYAKLVKDHGGTLNAHWQYAFALAWPDGRCETMAHNAPRVFVAKPSRRVMPGYPLESLQIDPATGKYLAEMSAEEHRVFWHESLGGPLAMFVTKYIV